MNLDLHTWKAFENLGTVSKMGFIFLDSFSLGSDSQAPCEENRRDSIGEELSLKSVSTGENGTRRRDGRKENRVCVDAFESTTHASSRWWTEVLVLSIFDVIMNKKDCWRNWRSSWLAEEEKIWKMSQEVTQVLENKFLGRIKNPLWNDVHLGSLHVLPHG